MNEKKPLRPRPARASRPRPRHRSEPRMHPITFCTSCREAIPAQALACFRCGARQPAADGSLQVVFCEKCDRDFPVRAMACHHCGHLNPRHPYLKGHIAG